MSASIERGEGRLYKYVRDFLHKELKCVVESFDRNRKPFRFERRGRARLIVDVYGLRGILDRNSRFVEGIAVEVKPGRGKPSLRSLSQALQYNRLAHRCYLAKPCTFDENTKLEASRLGVGLMQISSGRVRVVSESRPFDPDPEVFLTFLHRSLNVVQCGLCGCFRFRYKNVTQLLGYSGKTGGHFRRDQVSPLRRPNDKYNKRVYFCRECNDLLYGTESRVKLLERRIRRLERKSKSKRNR